MSAAALASPPALSPAQHSQYLLRLADNALVLGQRLAEWCGHGPILEEDLSLTNTALDLIGQARLLYTHAGQVEARDGRAQPRTEDDFAYWRNEGEFRNWTLCELSNAALAGGAVHQDLDYAVSIARNFLYSALMVELWDRLQQSADTELAAIAAKFVKEARYHLRHAAGWVVRFGDGTAESRGRVQAALAHLLPYMNEVFRADALEQAAAASGVGVDPSSLQDAWLATVQNVLAEATLPLPDATPAFLSTGKSGAHSEHMDYLLAEMQSLARQHPGATW